MSDHLRLVSDNTTAKIGGSGKLVAGPGFRAAKDPSRPMYTQSFVFLESDRGMIIMHNSKEVSAIEAVDAMAAVATYLYRRGLAAQTRGTAPREPTIYDDLGAGALDVRRQPARPIAAEDSPEDGA